MKRKRGRPVRKSGGKNIGFYVSAEHHAWLTALPNRSEWLAGQVEKATQNDPKSEHRLQPSATRQPKDRTETT